MKLIDFLNERGHAAEVVKLVLSLSSAIVEISDLIRKGAGNKGKVGEMNASGEEQIAMDIQSNDIVARHLEDSGVVGIYASEELEEEVRIDDGGDFAVAFDPLDGSSLADANLSVGSIFGLYKTDSFIGVKGSEQIGAMIAVYGPSLVFMFTLKDGVHSFIYDFDQKEFVLLHENMVLEDEKKYFAPGNLKATTTEDNYLKLMDYWMKNEYKLRYSGGMVPDVYHMFIKKGGVFCYPGYVKLPLGKLRVLYECAPIALIAEVAGGAAYVRPHERVLDVSVDILAQRTPIFVGSKFEVKKAVELMYE